jgi:hypothetical protein
MRELAFEIFVAEFDRRDSLGRLQLCHTAHLANG